MSLEQAMLKQAEASEKLAAAFNRYADVVEKFGLRIVSDNEGKTPNPDGKADKPGKEDKPAGARGRPKKTETPEPEPEQEEQEDDDDGFGGEDEAITAPKDLTHDKVKAKLLEYKNAVGDKEPALAIIRKYGYDTIPSVKEKHFAEIWVDAETALRKL